MAIIAPPNAANPMSEDIGAVRLVPPYDITLLFSELPKVSKHKMPFELRHRDLLPFDPHPVRAMLEHQLIIAPPVEQRLNSFNNLRVQRHVVLHSDLVLRRLNSEHGLCSP
jgi:hypothetical protein